MAGYNTGTKYSGNKNQSVAPVAKVAATTSTAAETLFSTGLWLQEKGPALASVQVTEDVTIPAGSYINMYDNRESKKTDKHPDFAIKVRPGKLKQRA